MALGVVVPHEQRVDPGEHPPRRLARIVVKSGSPQEGGARRECRPVHALVLPVYHPLRRLPLRRVLYLDPGHSYTGTHVLGTVMHIHPVRHALVLPVYHPLRP
eukprot:5755993-Pyramimonas_sp.AAC.1